MTCLCHDHISGIIPIRYQKSLFQYWYLSQKCRSSCSRDVLLLSNTVEPDGTLLVGLEAPINTFFKNSAAKPLSRNPDPVTGDNQQILLRAVSCRNVTEHDVNINGHLLGWAVTMNVFNVLLQAQLSLAWDVVQWPLAVLQRDVDLQTWTVTTLP